MIDWVNLIRVYCYFHWEWRDWGCWMRFCLGWYGNACLKLNWNLPQKILIQILQNLWHNKLCIKAFITSLSKSPPSQNISPFWHQGVFFSDCDTNQFIVWVFDFRFSCGLIILGILFISQHFPSLFIIGATCLLWYDGWYYWFLSNFAALSVNFMRLFSLTMLGLIPCIMRDF